MLTVKLAMVLNTTEKLVRLSLALHARPGVCRILTAMIMEYLGTTTSAVTLTKSQEHGATPPVLTRDGNHVMSDSALIVIVRIHNYRSDHELFTTCLQYFRDLCMTLS